MPFSVASGMMDGAIWGVQPIFRARAVIRNASSIIGSPRPKVAVELNSSQADADVNMPGRARALSEEAVEEAILRDRRDRSHQFTPLRQLLGHEHEPDDDWDLDSDDALSTADV